MPLVRVRTYLGKKLLGEPTRPYAAETTVKAVVDRAHEPLKGIELVGTVVSAVARGALESSAVGRWQSTRTGACLRLRHDGVHTKGRAYSSRTT